MVNNINNNVDSSVNISEEKDSIIYTDDQQKAINGLIDFIDKPFNPNAFMMGLTGSAGTGKSTALQYIIKHSSLSPSTIRLCAPTHKACRVLNGILYGENIGTIHSMFGFRMDLKLEDFDPENPKFNPQAEPKIENARLLIIDESSMLNAKLVNYIYKICGENEIKIIFVGDDHQLFPVNERSMTAFSRCSKLYVLHEIIRQTTENPIAHLLPLLRSDIDTNGWKFISYLAHHRGESHYNKNNEGYSICDFQAFKTMIDTIYYMNKEEYLKDIDSYRIIAYTNARVTGWNNYIRRRLIKNADTSILTKHDLLMSYSTIVDRFLQPIIENSEEYIVKDITDYVDTLYHFKCFNVRLQKVHGGDITKNLYIIDHTDKETFQKYFDVINKMITKARNAGANRGAYWKKYYDFKDQYLLLTNILRNGQIIHSRDIDYGFAITAHRAQGSTYNTVFIDVPDMIYQRDGTPYSNQQEVLRRLYVACSRPKSELILYI